MSIADVGDLVVAELAAEGSDQPATETNGRSLTSLVEALESTARNLSGGIELVTALEDLRAAGYVESVDDDRGTVYALTPAGEAHAQSVRDRIEETPIEVVDDAGRRELSLGDAAAAFDRSLGSLAADCTGDCVYYRDDEPAADAIVGRDEERDRCRSVVERVREDRRGRAVFLTGPGGVGKTALAEDVLEAARGDGFDVVRTRCRSAGEPYEPLQEWLGALGTDASFAEDGPAVDDSETLEAQQTALFYDLTAAFEPTDGEPPRVLFVDDLHLADPATMAYLGYLLEHLSEHPLVLLGTYRPAEMPDDAPVAAGTVPDGASATHLRLSSLDRDATRAVVERVTGTRGPPAAFVDAVHERTGGNPLFVEETVSRLLETDQLDPRFEWYPDGPEAIEVPDAVGETIDLRVTALDDDARQLLRWAAVIGDRVPLAVLRRVCDLSRERFEALLEALVEADVFDRLEDGDAITFRSEVVEDALVTDLDDDERRDRHDAVATALEEALGRDETVEDDDGDAAPVEWAATIAAHHERAGNAADAVEWYRRAGDRATDVYAHDAAADHYRDALALARDGDDEETVLSLAERLTSIYRVTGELERAERYGRFVRERTTDPDRIRRMAVVDARIANERGDFETALERAADGLSLADGPSESAFRLLGQQAVVHRKRGDFERASEVAEERRSVAAAVGDRTLEARAVKQLGVVANARGEYETAREHFLDALETFRATDDRKGVAEVRDLLGTTARREGDLEAALEHSRAALEAYGEVGTRRDVVMTLSNLGVVLLDRGEYGDAREHFRRALEEGRAIDNRRLVAICRYNLGSVAIQRGAYDVATEHLRDALEEFESMDDRRSLGLAYTFLGKAALGRSEYDAARRYATDGLEVATEVGHPIGVGWANRTLGAIAVETRDYETADERLDRALEVFEDAGSRTEVAKVRALRGALALERDDRETAHESVRQALETFAETGNVDGALDALETVRSLVRAHRDRGDEDRARDLRRRAANLLEGVDGDVAARHREWLRERRDDSTR